jgi:hypothetical protein
MYTIPAHRGIEARRATIDLRVVRAGPIGMVPGPPVARHRGSQPVGLISSIIGAGA